MKLLLENWRKYLAESEEETDTDKIIKLLKSKHEEHHQQARDFLSMGLVDLDQFIQALWDTILPLQEEEEARGGVGPAFADSPYYYYLRNGIATLVGACDPYCEVHYIPANKYTPVHPKYGPYAPMFRRHSSEWSFEEFREMFKGKL